MGDFKNQVSPRNTPESRVRVAKAYTVHLNTQSNVIICVHVLTYYFIDIHSYLNMNKLIIKQLKAPFTGSNYSNYGFVFCFRCLLADVQCIKEYI